MATMGSRYENIAATGQTRQHLGITLDNYVNVAAHDHARQHNGDVYYNYHQSQSPASGVERNFQRLDRAIDDLQQAIEYSDAVERLHAQEIEEIDNALQYGLVFSLLLNRNRADRLSGSHSHDSFEDMVPRMEKVTELVIGAVEKLEGASMDFGFDLEIQATRPYSASLSHSGVGAEAEASPTVSVHPSSTIGLANTLPGPTRPNVARSFFHAAQSSHYPSVTSEWANGAGLHGDDVHLAKVNPMLCVYDDSSSMEKVECLLDTGASHDCISRERRKAMSVRSFTRKVATQRIWLGDKSTVKVTRVVKLEWRFDGKEKVYESLFYEVPNLAENIIIGRKSIFDHDLLISNPEYCMLGQTHAGREGPTLTILDFLYQPKQDRKAQKEADKQHAEANRKLRDAEYNRLADEFENKSRTHPSSANTQTPASSTKTQTSSSTSGQATPQTHGKT